MKNEFSAAPVGAEEVVSVLAEVCANGAAHKHCGIAPPAFRNQSRCRQWTDNYHQIYR